ncbi:MAG: hypothetical protein JWM34_1669 [Ilumatobacteraceae bacterium]|nr:hypothetical protein [Ilumatobacteraceae bacterium]
MTDTDVQVAPADAGEHDLDGIVSLEPEIDPTALRVWIPAARMPVLVAMEAAGIVVIDSPDGASYAIVSTRLARHRITEYTAQANECGLAVVVLVHPGGESIAVEALRAGGHVAIAEGDADALRALSVDVELDSEKTNSLLDAYEARLGRNQIVVKSNVAMFDPISGLPAAGALSARMNAGTPDPDQNLRVVAINIPGLGDPVRLRLGADAHALLHRRMSMGVRLMCQPLGELYDDGDGSFLLLAPKLSTEATEALGHTLSEIVGGYTPDGHLPLNVAIGHAGPECSSDLSTLRELAGRAEAAAGQEDRSTVLGAGELVGPLATATELEVTLRLADLADERIGALSRPDVVATAADLAVRLGFEGRERTLIRFCAEVGDIGAALSNEPSETAELSARLIGATAGPTVSAALRAVGERWDGTGLPDGLAGNLIPDASRIIAVATALVAASFNIDTLEPESGTRFDPTVIAAAKELVKQR